MSTAVTTVKLDPDTVREIFRTAESQNDYFVGLFKLVHPDWERIESLLSFPVCSPDTWGEICKLAMTVDARINTRLPFDRQLLPGGGWMNSGFSTDNSRGLALWEVVPADRIVYHES